MQLRIKSNIFRYEKVAEWCHSAGSKWYDSDGICKCWYYCWYFNWLCLIICVTKYWFCCFYFYFWFLYIFIFICYVCVLNCDFLCYPNIFQFKNFSSVHSFFFFNDWGLMMAGGCSTHQSSGPYTISIYILTSFQLNQNQIQVVLLEQSN